TGCTRLSGSCRATFSRKRSHLNSLFIRDVTRWPGVCTCPSAPSRRCITIRMLARMRSGEPQWTGSVLTWLTPVTEEPFSPPFKTLCYRVRFYYVQVNKKEDFWKEEGKHWNKDVEGFVGRNHGVLEAVNQTVAPGDTPEQKAQKVYAFVAGLENR